jgi:hypothetical protein
MLNLGGIWAANQPLAANFNLVGGQVTCSIAAACVAACTNPSGSLTLIESVPAPYRPANHTAGVLIVRNKDVLMNGLAMISPQGHMTIVPFGPYVWQADAGLETTGVSAQNFSYAI